MNFLKSYKEKSGLSDVITKDNSSLDMLEMSMLMLSKGEKIQLYQKSKDTALVILYGTCGIKSDKSEMSGIGKRKTVFDGPAATIFIPMDENVCLTAETDIKIAVSYSPATVKYSLKVIQPDEVVIKNLGANGWKREAHFNLDERTDANLFYIGEAFVEGGMWASYPPHKHDEDNMPTEGVLEEVYYYEFDKPSGFGIQRVYDKEGTFNETYTLKTGDFVEIPKGYHPYTCAPGYKGYYLWVMAGKNRGFFMTTEEGHKWLLK